MVIRDFIQPRGKIHGWFIKFYFFVCLYQNVLNSIFRLMLASQQTAAISVFAPSFLTTV